MTPDIDIWRAANLLIQQLGEFAKIAAERRADELGDRGDAEGQQVWERIRQAVIELQAGPTGPAH